MDPGIFLRRTIEMNKAKSFSWFFGLFILLTDCGQVLAQSASPAAGPKTGAAGSSPYVSGRIFDKKFEVSKAFYSARTLILRSRGVATNNPITPEGYQGIKITFAENQQFEGKSYMVAADQEKMLVGDQRKPRPLLDLYAMVGRREDHYLDVVKNRAPYTMTLNFYKRQNQLLPGFIELEIQNSPTKIKGYFWAAPE
jgi:hypothetical protein